MRNEVGKLLAYTALTCSMSGCQTFQSSLLSEPWSMIMVGPVPSGTGAS